MATQFVAFNFTRQARQPLDASGVFEDWPALQTYLTSGPAYGGQLVAVTDVDPPEVYVVVRQGASAPFTYTVAPIGAGGGGSMPEPPDDDQLYGRTRAPSNPTGAWEEVSLEAAGVAVGTATPPATPSPGSLWSTINGEVFVWHPGGFWVQIG